MNITEQNTGVPSFRTGVFRRPRALRGVRGKGARSHGAFALIFSSLVLGLAFAAAPAVAAGTPKATVEADEVTASTAYLRGYISAGYGVAAETTETKWRMEYSTVGASGPWTDVPGGSGTISTAEANSSLHLEFGVHFTGLSAATKYYVRVSAVSEEGSAESIVSSFSTVSPPTVTTFATHTLDGETVRAMGFVKAGGTPTNELQTVTVGGGATGGTFKLCMEGRCTGATGTGMITEGSTQITDLETSSGVFAYDEEVFGVGIPNGSFIEGKGTGAGGLPHAGPQPDRHRKPSGCRPLGRTCLHPARNLRRTERDVKDRRRAAAKSPTSAGCPELGISMSILGRLPTPTPLNLPANWPVRTYRR